jgi:D-xylose transport system ATP-binding protein
MTEHRSSDVVLEVRGVSKFFGSVSALTNVSLTLRRGETLALLGDNGAGKSTLVKILSGLYKPDAGSILLEAEEANISDPHVARALGIETVYQDLALFDNLTAAENFFVGREPRRPAWLKRLAFVDKGHMRRATAAVLERLRVGVRDPSVPVGQMSGGQRQAVAVGRAEAFARRIIILDEPTAALGVRESRAVLELIKRLPERGISVILVSHNMEQVMEVADRAVVLRQGRNAGDAVPSPENHERIVSMIVGYSAMRDARQKERGVRR